MVDCLAPEQSLRCGDIIVAIERRVLIDLSEEDVEETFGAEFCDGAALVVPLPGKHRKFGQLSTSSFLTVAPGLLSHL